MNLHSSYKYWTAQINCTECKTAEIYINTHQNNGIRTCMHIHTYMKKAHQIFCFAFAVPTFALTVNTVLSNTVNTISLWTLELHGELTPTVITSSTIPCTFF